MTAPNVFMNFDKRGAEWVVVAYYAQDENMIAVVVSGRDIHIATAHLATGVPEAILKKEHKVVGLEVDPRLIERLRREHIPELFKEQWFMPRTMSFRQCYKKANHGLNYDMGPQRAALEWEMDYTEAKRVVDSYHRAYPGIRRNMHKGIERQLNKDRTLTNCYGRKRRFLDAWGHDLLKAAYDFIPQSTIADVTGDAMCLIYEDTSDLMSTVQLRLETHDSLMVQVPTDDWSRNAQIVQRICEYYTPTLEYHGREFIIETDLKIGVNVGEMVELPIISNDNKGMTKLLKQAWRKVA